MMEQTSREDSFSEGVLPAFYLNSTKHGPVGWQPGRAYALNELPQPHVVFACGFLIENPDPCRLST